MAKKKHSHDNLYYIARKLATQAMAAYDPFVKIEVKGPFEGVVVFSDGSTYKFINGRSEIHRKNLPEAYSLGCRKARKGV